jgi:TatA/E family protein of Tat protein translocase
MELMVILVLALVVLGPQRIPEVASNLGKAIRGFRKATKELRDQIDIEDEVRRPFEDLRAALRDEPARHRPAPLVAMAGDHNFPVFPLDPNYVPTGHGPVYGSNGEIITEAPPVAVFDPNLAVTSSTADPALTAGSPAGSPAAAATATASLVSPPDEPLVSANSGADHFQRAAETAPHDKGAS